MKKMVAGIILMLLGLLMVLAGLSLDVHGATTKHQNSLGAVISDINPVISLVGSEVDGQFLQASDGRMGTLVRIHPKATYALFDQSVLFCGDEADRLAEPTGALLKGWYAFTYKRQAARLIDGIACYSLVSVDKLEQK
jgi:hypothetical protein